jgi:hypothetical protein
VKSTSSWYPKVFIHVIILCVSNAFVLYTQYHKKPKAYAYLDFILALIEELGQEQLSKKGKSTEHDIQEKPQYYHAKHWIKNDKTRFCGSHYPTSIEANQANRHFERHGCMVCKRQVNTICEQCRVGLCCTLSGNDMSCFKKFHAVTDFFA